MIRVVLLCGDNVVEVPPGESIVGRDPSCRLRFNDPTVSRRHLQLFVQSSAVHAADLNSRNGSQINGHPLEGVARLKDGDEVLVGARRFKIQIGGAPAVDEEIPTETDARSRFQFPPAAPLPKAGFVVEPSRQNCSWCRASMPLDAVQCPACKRSLPAGRSLSVTQSVHLEDIEAAASKPSATRDIDMPLLYSSSSLTFEAVGRDLRRDGLFVATQLLEPVGTHCGLILLPDGSSTLHLHGRIKRVVEEEDAGDGVVGIDVEFDALDPDAQSWIERQLQK